MNYIVLGIKYIRFNDHSHWKLVKFQRMSIKKISIFFFGYSIEKEIVQVDLFYPTYNYLYV